jgi:hypothetical protein
VSGLYELNIIVVFYYVFIYVFIDVLNDLCDTTN